MEYGVAFVLAVTGDSSQAQALANDLERRFPEDTSVRFNYLPTVRALLALNRSESFKAIEVLQVTAPYDLARPPAVFMVSSVPLSGLRAWRSLPGRTPGHRSRRGIPENLRPSRDYCQ